MLLEAFSFIPARESGQFCIIGMKYNVLSFSLVYMNSHIYRKSVNCFFH